MIAPFSSYIEAVELLSSEQKELQLQYQQLHDLEKLLQQVGQKEIGAGQEQPTFSGVVVPTNQSAKVADNKTTEQELEEIQHLRKQRASLLEQIKALTAKLQERQNQMQVVHSLVTREQQLQHDVQRLQQSVATTYSAATNLIRMCSALQSLSLSQLLECVQHTARAQQYLIVQHTHQLCAAHTAHRQIAEKEIKLQLQRSTAEIVAKLLLLLGDCRSEYNIFADQHQQELTVELQSTLHRVSAANSVAAATLKQLQAATHSE